MSEKGLNKTEQQMLERGQRVAVQRGAAQFLSWARGFTAPARRGDVPRRPRLERELAALYRRTLAGEAEQERGA